MRVVGILLVSSLLTLPVAAALQVGRSFRTTALLAYAFAVFSVLCGLFVSYHANLAPGGSIVLTAVILFVLAAIYRKIFARGGTMLVKSHVSRCPQEEGLQANAPAAEDY
jgi:zinc transport system permease protein